MSRTTIGEAAPGAGPGRPRRLRARLVCCGGDRLAAVRQGPRRRGTGRRRAGLAPGEGFACALATAGGGRLPSRGGERARSHAERAL